MFCRFGSCELSRPVAATSCLNDVCTRPVCGMDQLRQGIDVGALELGVLAILDDLAPAADAAGPAPRALRHPCWGRSWCVLTTGSLNSSNRSFAELVPRIDVELAAGDLEDLALQPHDPVVELAGQLAQPGHIDADAVEFHLRQHFDQRHFEVGEQLVQASAPPAAAPGSRISRSGTSASSAAYWVISGDRDFVHPLLLLAAADELVDRDRLVAEMAAGQVVQVVAPLARIEQIVGHHRVERDARAARRPPIRSTIMSYFRFWPIFSIAGFSSIGRRASRDRWPDRAAARPPVRGRECSRPRPAAQANE